MSGVALFVQILLCIVPSYAQTRIIPHLTRTDGGFSTSVEIFNSSQNVLNYSIQPWSMSGEALPLVTDSIAAHSVISRSVESLFGSQSAVSHFTMTQTPPDIAFTIAYRTNTGAGSPAHLSESSQTSRRWRLFPGDWSLVFDGIAVVNMGDADTPVVVRQMDFTGRTLMELTVFNLPVRAKGLYVLGAPSGTEFSSVPDTYFEIIASQPVAMTALRGTPPGSDIGYLWENTATPMSTIPLGPLPLNKIRYWAYQIQEVNLHQSIETMAQSRYDMLVIEPTRTDWSDPDQAGDPQAREFDTLQAVRTLKNSLASDGIHRKRVIAYIDIGQAEDWRWYWNWAQRSPDEDEARAVCSQTPFPPPDWPSFIVKCDPDNWLHNYPVTYWSPEWQNIVITGQGLDSHPWGTYHSIIDEVIQSGFDGIYLDWVEAAEDEDIIAAAQHAGHDAIQEMIDFIGAMRARAQQSNPDFVIIQQNAASLIENPALPGVIDAIAQEATWYDGDATDDWNDADGYDHLNDMDLTQYYLNLLRQFKTIGLPVFSCEYALEQADDAYTKAGEEGFIPYVTRRSLGQLTSTPPPGLSGEKIR
jgi:cysteinyl-tRNA synthetase